MQDTTDDITTLLLITTFLILLMGAFILSLLFMHRRKQLKYLENISEIKLNYEKSLLTSQLEIQEQTFQYISQEIHDNISLNLTLVKLNLNTLSFDNRDKSVEKLDLSIDLLTQSISQLRDLSKSLDSDLIKRNGLLSAIEEELKRINGTEICSVNYVLTGTPVYMSSGVELIVFRIIQEAFNNILKHAQAKTVNLNIDFGTKNLSVCITDDGVGFERNIVLEKKSGLKNIESRVNLLRGEISIVSKINNGTNLKIKIPFSDGK